MTDYVSRLEESDREAIAALSSVDLDLSKYGDGFVPAFGADTTNELIERFYDDGRPDTPPAAVGAIECRIGLSKFFVPPINITVNSRFKAGALSNGAIRRRNAPKFNSGNKETVIAMDLYFPNIGEVYGQDGFVSERISSDATIERFASSLRGLITQFKFAPFLPVRNVYLNQTHGITGVTLKSLSVGSVEGFPGVMAARLEMYKFNHKVFMPMVEDFNNAIHWGRFRTYFIGAARRMDNESRGLKLIDDSGNTTEPLLATSDITSAVKTPEDVLKDYQFDLQSQSASLAVSTPKAQDVREFDFYFPFFTPAGIEVPDLDDLISNGNVYNPGRGWWDNLINVLNLGTPITERYKDFSYISNLDEGEGSAFLNEDQFITEYLSRTSKTVLDMSAVELSSYKTKRARELGISPSSEAYGELSSSIDLHWMHTIYKLYSEDVVLAEELAEDERRRRNIRIQEWLVPMQKLELDPKIVHVQNVSVRMSNIISRLQLQMQDEPTHQHLGGEDTIISLDIIISGGDSESLQTGEVSGERSAEGQLYKLRKMFESVSGRARLAHSHGTLGFLGIKSPITGLAGIKHVVPLSFNVNTIPNMPHSYHVTIELMDFDIFQQNREAIDSSQQALLVQQAGKHNPFLRIKQYWNLFSCYPDMPLDVRDGNRVVGYLSPSHYFKSFEVVDGKLMEHGEGTVDFVFGLNEEDGTAQNLSVGDRGEINVEDQEGLVSDPETFVPKGTFGGTTLSPPSVNTEHYKDGDMISHFEKMTKDIAFRDKGGSMIKAFPTYMLWLIDESGHFAGFKLFDNFYGLQSVIDMSLNRSQNNLADTLTLRVSNLYSNLSTSFQGYLNEDSEQDKIVNRFTTKLLRTTTGTGGYILDVDSISLRPGMRVHLRMGYSSNPNQLEPVFNGVITEVQQGEIMNIVAQSDAVELGAIVNSTDKKGSSGSMDGSFGNLYMSEPRDLMVTLLSQGASTAKEVIAHASRGTIFSENRHGIKHFGMILYTDRSKESEEEQRRELLDRQMTRYEKIAQDSDGNGLWPLLSEGTNLYRDYYISLGAKRDFEIFKRNIYPGNALGVAQFLGGDVGDIMLKSGVVTSGAGVTGGGEFRSETTATTPVLSVEEAFSREFNADLQFTLDNKGTLPADLYAEMEAWLKANGVSIDHLATSESDLRLDEGSAEEREQRVLDTSVGALLNLVREDDDDLPGVPEISFRAQTYMKTVWDLFKTCAAMMPDYIVAVRPFEDRSTVFYGKPHWLYTSGVIPITYGRDIGNAPEVEGPDEELRETLLRASQELSSRDIQAQFERLLAGIRSSATRGISNIEGSTTLEGPIKEILDSLPTTRSATTNSSTAGAVAQLTGYGRIGVEMHLPLSSDLLLDKQYHDQLSELPEGERHPFYMDRKGGVRGGEVTPSLGFLREGKSILGEDGNLPGEGGALGYIFDEFDGELTKKEAAVYEKWYCNQRWTGPNGSSEWRSAWRHARILIYSPDTNKAVVCTPLEYGPHGEKTDKVAGCSPDAFYALGRPQGKNCYYRVMPDDTPLGPVNLQKDDNLPKPERITGVPQGNGGNAQAQADRYFGYRKEGIPVNSSRVDDEGNTVIDQDGLEASALYIKFRDEDRANEIWDQFRKDDWNTKKNQVETLVELVIKNAGGGDPKKVEAWLYNDPVPELVDTYMSAVTDIAIQDGSFNIDTKNELANVLVPIVKGIGHNPDKKLEDYASNVDHRKTRAWILIDNFKRLMWQTPYARGWLVLVVNDRLDPSDLGLDSFSGDTYDLALPAQVMNSLYSSSDPTGISVSSNAMAFMTQNEEAGGIPVFNALGEFASNVKGAFSEFVFGALGFLRSNLLTTLQASINIVNAEANANILNRTFNDSIYYKEGVNNKGEVYDPLAFSVDNPFTREYGEPVVEVREPFQRIHHISSFQHIINNGIIESINNVATIVTASSNEKKPVTVYFDRNATTDRQVEKVIDTGIHADGNFRDALHTSFGDKINSEILSKRIATAHLKESLKDIYQGEIILIGDASIRPYDLIYIADSYLKIYGFVEVEDVIHHFTPEMGFITTIVPNAVVTANDPARFYFLASGAKKNAIQAVRDEIRNTYNITTDDSSSAVNTSGSVTIDDLARRTEGTIVSSTQTIGGASAALKTVMTNASYNLSQIDEERAAQSPSGFLAPLLSSASSFLNAGSFGLLNTDLWGWVRDNVLDQSSCFINYLNKNGRPMDAGLNFADGVAVGQMATRNLIIAGVGVAESAIRVGTDDDPRINLGDLIPQLQYTKRNGLTSEAKEMSLFVNEANIELRRLSGRGGEDAFIGDSDLVDVYLVEVKRIVDSDTIEVRSVLKYSNGNRGPSDLPATEDNGNTMIRLGGAQAPEDDYKGLNQDTRDSLAATGDLGISATEYVKSILPIDRRIAIRTNAANLEDRFNRILGNAFINAPLSMNPDSEEAIEFRLRAAGAQPLVGWDSFTFDGQPYTLDYQLIVTGFADTYVGDVTNTIPGFTTGRRPV